MQKRIPDNSVDMILADLPYGNTACKWGCDKLLRAVKRASLVGEGIITLLTEQNLLKIESEGEKGNAHEEVECDIEGDEIKINCDASFLLDGLKVLEEDEVEIKLIDKLNPIHIEENNFRYIVMPIRDDT